MLFEKMSGKQAVFLILGLGVLIAAPWSFTAWLESEKAYKIESLKSKEHIEALRALSLADERKDAHMVAIYSVWYNWMRQHKSLNKWTPAMAAELTDRLWSWEEIVIAMDADQPAKKRGPYKKTQPVD